MAIRVIRLGTPRAQNEGMRFGTVRRPPRGVKKSDFARLNWYDLWLPDLAPSAQLASWALADPWTDERWKRFTKAYLKEMKEPAAQRLLAVLAALSRDANFSVGCYCADASRCHRALLKDLLIEAGAVMHEDDTPI